MGRSRNIAVLHVVLLCVSIAHAPQTQGRRIPEGRIMDSRAPSPLLAEHSMPEATFMREGPIAAAPRNDAVATQSAKGLLQRQQPSGDHDTLAQDSGPNLPPGSSSLPTINTPSATSAPPAATPVLAPTEEDVCPRPRQCDYEGDETSGRVSEVCTHPPPRPRTWAGVCPESMPFLVLGCILDAFILAICIRHFVKRSVWVELYSLGFWGFVYLVHGNVFAVHHSQRQATLHP